MKKALILFIISVMILISLLIIKSYTKSTEPPPPKRNLKSIESLVPPAPKKPIKKERINDTQRETREEMHKRIRAMSSEERRKIAEGLEAKIQYEKEHGFMARHQKCRKKCKTIPCDSTAYALDGSGLCFVDWSCHKSCMSK